MTKTRRVVRSSIVTCLFLVAAVSASAATITIRPAAGQTVAPQSVRLIARQVIRSVSADQPQGTIERLVEAPGSADWPLAPDAAWQIDLAGEGVWAAPSLLPAGAPELSLEVWPTGRVAGMLLPPQDVRPPREVRLRFASSRRLTTAPVPPNVIVCPVVHTRFTCQVPAAADLDLRVKAEGFVSRFFWHRRVAPDQELSLGPVPLVRGGSVAGWIVTEEGEPPKPEQRVELALVPAAQPATAGEGPGEERDETAKVADNGFFQVVGVLPGRYVARATAAGGLRAASAALTVLPDRDSELIDPLVLLPPLDVVVQVSPPAEPDGGAWRVDLQAEGRTVAQPRSGRTDAAGAWRVRELVAGRYMVVVRDGRGRRLHVAEVEVDADDPRVEIEIERVEVAGRVWLGDQPLAARVILGGRSGAVSLATESDEEGRFTGWVPREGPWRVDVVASEPPVLRRLVDVPIERAPGSRVARVELRLPGTLLEGEVVDAEGRPVDGAVLLVLQVPAAEPILDRRVRAGRFALRGLVPGTYRLEAVAGSREEQVRSESVDVVLEEAAPYAHARLVLAPPLVVEGQVTGAWGAVPGAEVFARPLDQPPHTLGISTTTDFEGRFRLRLPPATRRADLLVMAPGYALAPLAGVAVGGRRPLALRLDEAGGDLLLGLDRPVGQWPHPIVERQGQVIASSSMLQEWMRRNGAPAEADRLIVPNLPPGFYRVCRAAADQPLGPPSCDEGVLNVGGVLELSPGAADPSEDTTKELEP